MAKSKKKKKTKAKKIPVIIPPPEFFEDQIINLNRELASIRQNQVVYWDRNDSLRLQKEQVIEDRKDVNIFVERELQTREIQHTELTVIHTTLISEFQEVKQEAAAEIKVLNEFHDKWKTVLESDIRILQGKLELYHKEQVMLKELTTRQREFHKKAITQSDRIRQELYDTEREIVIRKHELTKEVQNRLDMLGTSFNNTSGMRMLAHTRKILRENIALNWEMDRLLTTKQRLESIAESMRNVEDSSKTELIISKDMNRQLNKTRTKQKDFLEKLGIAVYTKTSILSLLRNAKLRFEIMSRSLNCEQKKLNENKGKLQHFRQAKTNLSVTIKCLTENITRTMNENQRLADYFQKLYNTTICKQEQELANKSTE